MPIYAVKHQITATNQFDGAAPTTTAVDSNGVRTYPTDTSGGLFDLASEIGASVPVSVLQVQILFGGQSSWTLSLNDGTDDLEITSGTTETDAIYVPSEYIILADGQKLKLETTGATTAMWASVIFTPAGIGGF